MDLLRYGVDVLSKLPERHDLPGGHGLGLEEPRAFTARMLRYIGISKVRGFMLNVTHHDWTSNNIAYGRKVSAPRGRQAVRGLHRPTTAAARCTTSSARRAATGA